MKWPIAITLSVLMVGLAACRTGKDVDPQSMPVSLPPQWGLATSGGDISPDAFNELKTDELDQWIALALQDNPDIRSMAARVQCSYR